MTEPYPKREPPVVEYQRNNSVQESLNGPLSCQGSYRSPKSSLASRGFRLLRRY